jgi:hypothetical protein
VIYCQIPVVPQNGIFSPVVNRVSQGEGLEVVCEQGYSIVGDANINCQDDGAWDHPVAVCELEGQYLIKYMYNKQR